MNTKIPRELVVLLTEDDVDDRELFLDAITDTGYQVHVITFEDGKALCEYLENGSLILPDIIFLDINMPHLNGKECLNRIKSNTLYGGVSIVILTTSSNPQDITDTLESGADRYIIKPNSFPDIVKMFQDVFEAKTSDELHNMAVEDFVVKYV